jgi:hypothetical protein
MPDMSQRFVKYFEAQIGAMLMQVTCNSAEHYIACLTFLEEKFPNVELIYREWSDGTEEDGLIEKEDWFRG